MNSIPKLLKEPLVQFLLIGVLIYGAYALFAPKEDSGDDIIFVTQGEIQWLEANWQKRWGRPPTPEEQQGLIDEHVREKVLYRTALDMGLDKEDVIVRRRMVQKIEFLTSDLIAPPDPIEGELEGFYANNQDSYRAPDAITITQVFFDPDKREDQTLDDAKAALGKLQKQGEPIGNDPSVGDPFMLQQYYPERSEMELAKLFGTEFARSVFSLEAGQWHGPVLSGYGTHLVYVHALRQSPTPDFADISERVKEDWEAERLSELHEKYLEGLMSRYKVVIEGQQEGPSNG